MLQLNTSGWAKPIQRQSGGGLGTLMSMIPATAPIGKAIQAVTSKKSTEGVGGEVDKAIGEFA